MPIITATIVHLRYIDIFWVFIDTMTHYDTQGDEMLRHLTVTKDLSPGPAYFVFSWVEWFPIHANTMPDLF